MPDPSFVFAQSLSGLTAAMFLFLIASGLSLIFGVLRVLNFAHGTFYMLGAYVAYQAMLWLGPGPGMFWIAALGAALTIALLGGLVERLLFRHLYGKEELYQLLFTYALGLILSDVAKIFWGTQQKSVSRPPGLTGSFSFLGATIPQYNLFVIRSRWPSGSCCSARASGDSSGPPRSTARRWARSARTSTRCTPGSSCWPPSWVGWAARS